jgi:iron donor protein CyaY
MTDQSHKLANDFTDDSSFRIGVQKIFEDLFEQLEQFDSDDFDIQMQTGSFIITFEEDDSVFMLSQQTPTHEIWLSANYEAWHFLCSSGIWIERDQGISLQKILQNLFSTKLSKQVEILL